MSKQNTTPSGVAGIGVDIEQIARIEAMLQKGRFLERFFGEEERAWLAARGNPPNSVTGNFCAKEAFSKALGTGVRDFALREVQVLRDALGKPYFRLDGDAAEAARGLAFELSISHTADTAVAFVVASHRTEMNKTSHL